MSVEIDYLERVESAESHGGEVAIHWEAMTTKHVENWQKNIQPSIAEDDGRPDRKWNWFVFFVGLQMFYNLQQKKPKFLTAFVRLPNGNAVPVGMLMMLINYPRIDGLDGGSVFTSYLTSAPESVLRQFGVKNCPKIGRALVDCGIVTSYQAGKNGHTWLHCTPLGKDWLVNFYKDKCKLYRFSKQKALPVKNLIVKDNDGRHFFTDAPLAKTLTKELDSFRPQPVKAR